MEGVFLVRVVHSHVPAAVLQELAQVAGQELSHALASRQKAYYLIQDVVPVPKTHY
jgi:hypothetical protein